MPKKTKSIPVNSMFDNIDTGIAIEKVSFEHLHTFTESEQSHRHDVHSFFLLEKGIVFIEIDFQKYSINPFSVVYMHPNQVHHIISFENVEVRSFRCKYSWAFNRLLDE